MKGRSGGFRGGVVGCGWGDWGIAKSAGEGARSGVGRENRGLTMRSANPLGKWPLQIAVGPRERQGLPNKAARREPTGTKTPFYVGIGSN